MAELTVKDSKRQIEVALARTRAELASSLGQLRVAVRQEFQWRLWVARYPLPTLGVAFALGFLIGRR